MRYGYAIVLIALLAGDPLFVNADESPIACDFGSKTNLLDCILRRHPVGSDVEGISAYLREAGFVLAEQAAGEDFLYFIRHSGSMSGYRVALIVYAADDKITKIRVR